METILFIAIVVILALVFDKTKKRKSEDEKNYTYYQTNKEKGNEYETKVAKHYILLGYEVIENGKDKGLQDGGIDIIAKKENEIILIQCKNWKVESKYRIREKEVKEFYGACQFFIDENNLNKDITVCIYAIPTKEIINTKANQIFKKHFKKCKYQII